MDREQTVIVIEDEPDAAEMIALLLEVEGFAVHIADGGRWGLELVRQHRPALVITDLHMPNVNGLEVLLAMRRDDVLKETPVMIVTADPSADMKANCMKLGVQSYLLKPFDGDELVGHVHTVLGA